MQLSNFDYHLPQDRIAQTPAEPRDSAKLLCLEKNSWQIKDRVFSDIADMLTKNDVLVVNETRVIKARLKWKIYGTEKECEVFLHKQISDNTWDCLVYPGKKLKPWTNVVFYEEELQFFTATIVSNSQKWRIVEFSLSGQEFLDVVDQIWETPLPPYIKDSDTPDERYQTVYNKVNKSWSVAAPTAGLHFTPELLEKLEKKWIQIEKICLHVGLGTFANVEVEDIKDHHMHSESAYISKETSHKLNAYKFEWKRIIAVWTTSVRTLESFTDSDWQLWHGNIDTEIFIYPGYKWNFVDSIITNFHLPKSTLMMLVSSFAGSKNIKKAYKHAIESEYRFFSFWDAMWLN